MRKDVKIQKPLLWLRAGLSALTLLVMVFAALNHRLIVYLCYQARGQAEILLSSKPLDEYHGGTAAQRENLAILPDLIRYSVDSLGYDETSNYRSIYDHGRAPVLWVLTASMAFSLEPVYWKFPLVGEVSYKGFFNKKLASLEYAKLKNAGYDVEISPVLAYSTLGWLSDPVFSGMLERGKGAFCNLIFHELFHATCYIPGRVSLNENLASFVAHKATVRFLTNDTSSLHKYLVQQADLKTIRDFFRRQAYGLDSLYSVHAFVPRHELQRIKDSAYAAMGDSLMSLNVSSSRRLRTRLRELNGSRNAYFVGYLQYESLQDSLENVFNKIYRRNIKKMVHHLKPH